MLQHLDTVLISNGAAKFFLLLAFTLSTLNFRKIEIYCSIDNYEFSLFSALACTMLCDLISSGMLLSLFIH